MRVLAFFLGLVFVAPCFGLSNEAKEFMKIIDELDAVHCEKRKLRREMALAQVERRDGDLRKLQERFETLNRDPVTTRLERRLGELQPFLERSPDPEDLKAINQQRVEAFYRCG